MNAAMPNAYSFTVRGLIAAAAAARSLERTASIRCPSFPRRMYPTATIASTQQISATQPKTGLGWLLSMPRNGAFGPRSRPNHVGSGTGEPARPPPQVLLTKPKFSMATAPASVTTDRLTPRTRTAETAVIRPITTATAMPARAATGNVMPKLTAMCEIVNPAAPASASWITEIWPTKPVTTTSDSAISAPISVLIRASRKSNGNTISRTAPTSAQISPVRTRCCGRGASGRLRSTISPRPGIRDPRQNSTTTMIPNASRSVTPGSETPPDCGNQDWADAYWTSEYMMAMPKLAPTAMPNEVNEAMSAAASAGMICSGSVLGSSWVIEAARMPSPPAIRAASSVLTSEMMFGDRPLSIAAASFSDTALVASPNRVHLYSAASAAAATITIPVRMNRLIGTTAPKICTTLVGRMPGSGCGVTPKARIIADCAMSSTPSVETSLASGEELRSGR